MAAPVKKLAAWLIGLPFAALVITAMFISRDWRVEPPQLYGMIFTPPPADAQTTAPAAVLFTTEEERERRFSKGSSRRATDWITVRYSRYHLHKFSPSGEPLATVRLAQVDRAPSGSGPTILGTTTDTIWLWNQGLEARDLTTLAVKMGRDDLRAALGDKARLLPADVKAYRVSAWHSALIFRGTDTSFYQLDSAGPTLTPAALEPIMEHTQFTSLDEAFPYIPALGQAMFHTSPVTFQTKWLGTPVGTWFALLSDDERKKLTKWPGNYGHPHGEVARQLYRAPFHLDDRREVEIDPEKVEPIGSERFIQGAFLLRSSQAVWDVPDPSSSLVVCRQQLGPEEPWQLARLSREGQVVWRSSLGLKDFSQLARCGDWALFYGTAPKQPAAKPGKFQKPVEHLVWVEAKTGQVKPVDVAQTQAP